MKYLNIIYQNILYLSMSRFLQIEKNNEDVRITILTNLIKMMTERKLLDKNNKDNNIKKLIEQKSDEDIYQIDLNNNDKMYTKLLPHKITAISKTFGIIDFLNNFKDNPKIMIVKSISKKAHQYVSNNYPNTEIFVEEDLMINLIENELVPKHIPLDEEEIKLFYEKYNCKKKNVPKMLSTDPIAKYYNLKPGDVCRIIRPSEATGFINSYRLVIKGAFK